MVRAIPHQRIQFGLAIVLGLTILLLTGCGIIQGDPARTGGNGVVVTPDHANVRAGDTLQFTAQVTGGGAAPASSLPPRLPPPAKRKLHWKIRHPFCTAAVSSTSNTAVPWSVNNIVGGNSSRTARLAPTTPGEAII